MGGASTIYHAAMPEDWERARAAGVYAMSTRDRSLDDEGFIHCSHRHQVEQVTNDFFADLPSVVLLEIDPEQLNVAIVDESRGGGEELFPHVYGPLPLYAVVATTSWSRGNDGRYVFPAER